MRLGDFRRAGYRVPRHQTRHGRTHLRNGRQPPAQPHQRPGRICHRRPARTGSVFDVSDGDVLLKPLFNITGRGNPRPVFIIRRHLFPASAPNYPEQHQATLLIFRHLISAFF